MIYQLIPIATLPWLELPLHYLVSNVKIVKHIHMMYSVSKQLVQQRRESSNPQKVMTC